MTVSVQICSMLWKACPSKYFDAHAHGDICHQRTDALRQLVGQSIPTVISGVVALISAVAVMFFYSIWLTLVVFASCGNHDGRRQRSAAQYSWSRNRSLAVEIHEEMMKGRRSSRGIHARGGGGTRLRQAEQTAFRGQRKAHISVISSCPFSNSNIGNFLYVLIAIVGGLLICCGAQSRWKIW
ncbi:MAG: ABC transporter transmembrane domain-containing protein [Christensenellaceae bacterium]